MEWEVLRVETASCTSKKTLLIKFRFSDPKARDTFKKEFSENWVQYVIFSLVLVGSLSGLTLQDSERPIRDFVNNIGFENAEGIIAVYKIVVLSIFLPVITIVLAAVGAIFLSEAFDLHKQYRHITQLSLWTDPSKLKKGKEDLPAQINKEIEHIQDKIIKLQKEKESLEDKYIHAKALVNVQKSPPRFEDLINTLKSIAISLYMSGYELGKAETLSSLDETELILYLEKRKKI